MQALSGKDATQVKKKEKGQSSESTEELERKTVEEEDESLKKEGVNARTVSNYNNKEEEEEVEARTVVNYSKEEVKELLRKKAEVKVGRVILVNYKPAVLKKRKVKEGKGKQRRGFYTNRRRNSNIS